jgi:hypothetical protein
MQHPCNALEEVPAHSVLRNSKNVNCFNSLDQGKHAAGSLRKQIETAFQAEYEGSIPFTRSNFFNALEEPPSRPKSLG